jgi:hypothetical protein
MLSSDNVQDWTGILKKIGQINSTQAYITDNGNFR